MRFYLRGEIPFCRGKNKKVITVSLEAGLGFDAAITKVVSKKEGVLAKEFHRCLEEIRLGKTRREALSGIRERLDVDEIKAFSKDLLE